jgi:hypothetical protein
MTNRWRSDRFPSPPHLRSRPVPRIPEGESLMTGAEHYAEAERLVDIATKLLVETMTDPSSRSQLDSASTASAAMASVAQVHATLALASATRATTSITIDGAAFASSKLRGGAA